MDVILVEIVDLTEIVDLEEAVASEEVAVVASEEAVDADLEEDGNEVETASRSSILGQKKTAQNVPTNNRKARAYTFAADNCR